MKEKSQPLRPIGKFIKAKKFFFPMAMNGLAAAV